MVGKLIKAFCSAGPDASWGMFVSSRKPSPLAAVIAKKKRLQEKTGSVKLLLKSYGGAMTFVGETKG